MKKVLKYSIIITFIFCLISLIMYLSSLYTADIDEKEIFKTISIGFVITAGVTLLICFASWRYFEVTEDKVELALKKQLSDTKTKLDVIEKQIQKGWEYFNDLSALTEPLAHEPEQQKHVEEEFVSGVAQHLKKLQREERKTLQSYYSIQRQIENRKKLNEYIAPDLNKGRNEMPFVIKSKYSN